MDPKAFCDNPPGTLQPIEWDGRRDHAFVPAPLPPNWTLQDSLWPLLCDAFHLVGELKGLTHDLPNPAILLRPIENREAIESSRLEGTYSSPRELLLYELDPEDPLSEDDGANTQLEVFNYRRALYQASQSGLPISLRLIRLLHEILLKGVRGRDRAPGQFRRGPVAIGTGWRFVPPPHTELDNCLHALESYVHTAQPAHHPLVDCFLVHYQFETIHPFLDGNGRVGRLLLALMLQDRCRLNKPWLYLSEYFNKHRDEYIARLFAVSTLADWNGWVAFCLQGTLAHARDTISRCDQLLAERNKFLQVIQQAGGTVRLISIVEQLFRSPFVRIADLARTLNVTYPTAAADVQRLVEAGILEELPQANPKTYFARTIFDIAYQDLQTD